MPGRTSSKWRTGGWGRGTKNSRTAAGEQDSSKVNWAPAKGAGRDIGSLQYLVYSSHTHTSTYIHVHLTPPELLHLPPYGSAWGGTLPLQFWVPGQPAAAEMLRPQDERAAGTQTQVQPTSRPGSTMQPMGFQGCRSCPIPGVPQHAAPQGPLAHSAPRTPRLASPSLQRGRGKASEPQGRSTPG